MSLISEGLPDGSLPDGVIEDINKKEDLMWGSYFEELGRPGGEVGACLEGIKTLMQLAGFLVQVNRAAVPKVPVGGVG
jgi:hypothetical protein